MCFTKWHLKIASTTKSNLIHSLVNKTGIWYNVWSYLVGGRVNWTEMRSYKKWQTQQQISDFSLSPPTLSSSTVTVDFYGTACSATLPAAKCDGTTQLKCPHLQRDKTGEGRWGRGFCLHSKGPTVSNHYHLYLYPTPPPRCPRGWCEVVAEWMGLDSLFHPFVSLSEEGQKCFTFPPLVWWPAALWGQSVWAWPWMRRVFQNLGARLLSGGLELMCQAGVFLLDRFEMLCWLAGPWAAAAVVAAVLRRTCEWTGAPQPAALPKEGKKNTNNSTNISIRLHRLLQQTNNSRHTFRSCSAFRAACVPLGARVEPGGPRGEWWLCCGCCGLGWGMSPPLTLGDIGGPMGERWTPPAKELAWGGRTRGETMLGWDRSWIKREQNKLNHLELIVQN